MEKEKKEKTINEEFVRIIDRRHYLDAPTRPGFPPQHTGEYADYETICKVLNRDFDKTVAFISSATAEELGCAFDAMCDFIEILDIAHSKIILDVFTKRFQEVPNAQDYCESIITEQIDYGKFLINQKTE